MAGGVKIQLFKLLQKICNDIGIFPPESDQKHNSINVKNCVFLFCLAQFYISSAAYLLYDTNTNSMTEYGMVFFICATVALAFILYLIFYWQMSDILNYIENCEGFIKKSESLIGLRSNLHRIFHFIFYVVGTHLTVVYKNTNETIENITEFFAYALVVSIAIFLLLPLFYTIINYYILDSGKESFFLVFPTWFVSICDEMINLNRLESK